MTPKEDKFFKNYGYALTLSGIAFVVTVFLAFFVINPLYKNVQKTGKELAELDERYEYLQDKKTKLNELKDKEVELKEQAAIVSDALPQDEEIGRLFIQLDSLAKASNGTLKSVSKSTGSLDTAATSNLTSSGITKTVYLLPLEVPTYFDFKNFISNSELALRLFDINDFSISASEAGALSISLTANSYTRK